MNYIEHKGYLEITEAEPFMARHTFECGQCFRWKADEQGHYTGVAFGKRLTIWGEGSLCLACSPQEFETLWRPYLDLDRSYAKIAAAFEGDDYFQEAVRFGMGLRILAQEPWEALCSFILSQCNNISRIQAIVETLCREFGDNKGEYYTFPTAERIANLTLEELAVLKAGYRAKYVLSAARAVAGGTLNFDALRPMPTEAARKAVMALQGVGRKVADCFLLFGLQKFDAFPVDTWMKKAESHYDKKAYGANFGEYAGIAQQYLFYYARSGQKARDYGAKP